ncbi:MAG: fibronectin type III domain-containing protein [Candidatus Heimdallarchaeaceae archaeon]
MRQRIKVLTTLLLLLFFLPFTGSFIAQADDDFRVKNLHLSWQNDVTTTMTVSWRTTNPTSTVVEYGLTTSYGNEISWGEAVIWHHIELNNLSPETIYHYRAGNGEVWSPDYTFKTGTLSNQTNFICMGDAQANTPNRRNIVTAVNRISMDMMLYTGDYVETSTAADEYYSWFSDYARIVTDTATMGVLGNHEHNYSIWYDAWSFPGKEEYYSFDYGPIHVIGLHTLGLNYISDPADYAVQADWLRADLEANQDALWTIVMMHTPAFSSFHRYHSGLYELINETFVPIFEEYNVSLVLTGHEHAYERLLCNDVNYIIAGGAGSSLYEIYPGNQLNISIYAESTYNFLFLDISEDKLHVRAFRPDYSFIDQLILNKELKPDLSFQTLPLTYEQEWDQNLALNLLITNTGEENITTTTTLAYNENDTIELIDIPPLDVGEKHLIQYNWTMSSPGMKSFTFDLDYDTEVDEVSEYNNQLVINFIGQEKEETPTPTDEGSFLTGLIGTLIMLLSLVLPVFVKRIKKE